MPKQQRDSGDRDDLLVETFQLGLRRKMAVNCHGNAVLLFLNWEEGKSSTGTAAALSTLSYVLSLYFGPATIAEGCSLLLHVVRLSDESRELAV